MFGEHVLEEADGGPARADGAGCEERVAQDARCEGVKRGEGRGVEFAVRGQGEHCED